MTLTAQTYNTLNNKRLSNALLHKCVNPFVHLLLDKQHLVGVKPKTQGVKRVEMSFLAVSSPISAALSRLVRADVLSPFWNCA